MREAKDSSLYRQEQMTLACRGTHSRYNPAWFDGWEALGCSLRPVGKDHDARIERPGLHQLQQRDIRCILEESFALFCHPGDQGMHPNTNFINQPMLHQRMGNRTSTIQQDVQPLLLLHVRDCFCHMLSYQVTIVPRQCLEGG